MGELRLNSHLIPAVPAIDTDPCLFSPFPYHPFASAQAYGDVANSEGVRLDRLFREALGV